MSDGDDDNVVPMGDVERRRAAKEALDARAQLRSEEKVTDELKAMRSGDAFQNIAAGEWVPNRLGLPPHCPVVPLGRSMDNVDYILTACGTTMELPIGVQKKSALDNAFGRFNDTYLHWAWPRWDAKAKAWDTDTFNADKAYKAFAKACAILMEEEGAWDQDKMLRGRGAWLTSGGRMMLHLGNELRLSDGSPRPTGKFEGLFFAKRSSIRPPAKHEVPGGEGGPADKLLHHLKTWNWQRPEIDPMLILGWIGQAFVSGALDWRSIIWVVGGAGTGKSTLLELCEWLLLGLGQRSANTTAPAIYRGLDGDAGAVILDETESARNESKAKNLVELSRQAASGALIHRAGGPSGKVQSYPVFASFLFGAIVPPALESADYSRTALCELRPLKPGERGPWAEQRYCEEIGQELFRRMVDDYSRVSRAIDIYKRALMEAGHDSRGATAFGTLLGCGHALLWDHDPNEQDLDEWKAFLAPATLAELELVSSNGMDAWDVLLNAHPQIWRNGKEHKTVGAVLMNWRDSKEIVDLNKVKKQLADVGLGLVFEDNWSAYDKAMLFVPNISVAQNELTKDSPYHGRGKLVQSLKQLPESYVARGVRGYVNGARVRGLGIRLDRAFPQPPKEEAA